MNYARRHFCLLGHRAVPRDKGGQPLEGDLQDGHGDEGVADPEPARLGRGLGRARREDEAVLVREERLVDVHVAGELAVDGVVVEQEAEIEEEEDARCGADVRNVERVEGLLDELARPEQAARVFSQVRVAELAVGEQFRRDVRRDAGDLREERGGLRGGENRRVLRREHAEPEARHAEVLRESPHDVAPARVEAVQRGERHEGPRVLVAEHRQRVDLVGDEVDALGVAPRGEAPELRGAQHRPERVVRVGQQQRLDARCVRSVEIVEIARHDFAFREGAEVADEGGIIGPRHEDAIARRARRVEHGIESRGDARHAHEVVGVQDVLLVLQEPPLEEGRDSLAQFGPAAELAVVGGPVG
mmetsp:Transcript_22994/g.91194  ORF Transcript_22994/g.91194 Transcript_22994/m.91194 type:complete len:359 (-) Transcript_22994:335-1411(-)